MSLPVSAAAGSHVLTASWSGTATRLGSSSSPVLLAVRRAVSTTALSARAQVRPGPWPRTR